MNVTRRGFLKLMGVAVTLSAGGVALLEKEPIKTYFLPPRCGWNVGSWELACAQAALEAVHARIGLGTAQFRQFGLAEYRQQIEGDGLVYVTHGCAAVDALLARRARLIERCDKLARGWIPYRRMEIRAGVTPVIVHGGRESGTGLYYWGDHRVSR